jgi:serine/threonine protein kinase
LTTDDDSHSAPDPSEVRDFLRAIAQDDPPVSGAPDAAADDDGERHLVPGEVVDAKYRIDAPLGRGGMGSVYRATHLGTGREVALKVLVPELVASGAAVERFQREARALGRLRHPNVVDVTDFGFAERRGVRLAYLVMELLHGGTLRALVDRGRLPTETAIDILAQVCEAIAHAHALGVLHRDLKPENIHVEPTAPGRYRAKVLDFGIAKLVHEASEPVARPAASPSVAGRESTPEATPDASDVALAKTQLAPSTAGSLTRVGAAVGTARYMSPEQWRGDANDVRTDIYSLGIVAYEMLAGEPPFLGIERSLAVEHENAPPPSLALRTPGVPREVARVIEGALAKDPSARPPSATAFVAALQVRTETTLRLLRRSVALCVDHFGTIWPRTALATLPQLGLNALLLVSSLLVARGVVSKHADDVSWLVAQVVLFFSFFLSPAVAGGVVPLVAALSSARAAPSAPTVAELAQSVRRGIVATIAMVVLLAPSMTAAAFVADRVARATGLTNHVNVIREPLFQLVGAAILAPFAVASAIVVVERRSGLLPLRRSFALLRPMLGAAFGVTFFYQALTSALPALVVRALVNVATVPATNAGVVLIDRLEEFLIWTMTAAIEPFVLVPPALLYLRARAAEGEPPTGEGGPL